MQLALEEHPTVEALEELCFNRLPPTTLEAVEEHLLVCESCQRVLEDVEEYIQLMKIATAEYAAQRHVLRMPVARAWRNLRETAKRSSRASTSVWTALALASLMAAAWAYTSLRTDPPGSPIAVRLVAMRGGENSPFTLAPAGRPLGLAIDSTDLFAPGEPSGASSYRLEIVSSSGKPVWGAVPWQSGHQIITRTPKNLSPGVYWVRLYSVRGNELLREYGLRVE